MENHLKICSLENTLFWFSYSKYMELSMLFEPHSPRYSGEREVNARRSISPRRAVHLVKTKQLHQKSFQRNEFWPSQTFFLSITLYLLKMLFWSLLEFSFFSQCFFFLAVTIIFQLNSHKILRHEDHLLFLHERIRDRSTSRGRHSVIHVFSFCLRVERNPSEIGISRGRISNF